MCSHRLSRQSILKYTFKIINLWVLFYLDITSSSFNDFNFLLLPKMKENGQINIWFDWFEQLIKLNIALPRWYSSSGTWFVWSATLQWLLIPLFIQINGLFTGHIKNVVVRRGRTESGFSRLLSLWFTCVTLATEQHFSPRKPSWKGSSI